VLIRHFMSREVTVLSAETTCLEAWRFFRAHSLRRAPIVDDGRVIGMITDRDLLRVLPWTIGDLERPSPDRDPARPVRDVASRELVHVGPDDHLEVAADTLLRHRIGCLPVIENGELVGVITESDIFRVFARQSSEASSTRLTLQGQSTDEVLQDPIRLALACGVEILEYRSHESRDGLALVDLRVRGRGLDRLQERLAGAGFLLLDRQDPPAKRKG
jgi:acetoin utilization protein AcuB